MSLVKSFGPLRANSQGSKKTQVKDTVWVNRDLQETGAETPNPPDNHAPQHLPDQRTGDNSFNVTSSTRRGRPRTSTTTYLCAPVPRAKTQLQSDRVRERPEPQPFHELLEQRPLPYSERAELGVANDHGQMPRAIRRSQLGWSGLRRRRMV
ncbi:hypothetical protein XPA_004487 [Xanthoria parietina]